MARTLLDAETETMPPFWDELAGQGWLGIHVAEEYGGQGFGMLELAVVVEEMARGFHARPGLRRHAGRRGGVLGGRRPPTQGVAALAGRRERPRRGGPGRRRGPGGKRAPPTGPSTSSGRSAPVLGATLATRLLVPVAVDGTDVWCVVDLDGHGVSTTPLASLDPIRRVAAVTVEALTVGPERQLRSVSSTTVRDLALVLGAAECAGGARWCLETGTAYAIERRQFGRPIGQFQAIKHRLADMLVSVEQVTALAWDAAQAADAGDAPQAQLSAVLAGAFALDAYVECAKACIQILGGMGFTWEHDAHLQSAPGPDAASAGRGRARRCGWRPPAPPCTAADVDWPSSSPPTPSASGRRCGPWWPRWTPSPTPNERRARSGGHRAPHPALARRRGGAAQGRSSSS